MPRKPPLLTDDQKIFLKKWEPQLRACVKTGNIDRAKTIAAKIQRNLTKTGHTARWMQNANWLAECALVAGEISFAIQRIEAVRTIMSEGTRTHLEATVLLALCYIRRNKIAESQSLIAEALKRINNIGSDRRRQQFHKRLISRIEEECILAGIVTRSREALNAEEIQSAAAELQILDENSIIAQLGEAVPSSVIALLEGVRSNTLKLIPPTDRKLLPAAEKVKAPAELGKRVKAALRRVVWRAVCDPNDELYQAWSKGLSVVYDKKWISIAIISACASSMIGIKMIVITIVALAFKMGVNTFCDVFAPESIMIGVGE